MSFYGHASALYVKQGAKVTAGQKIAAVGHDRQFDRLSPAFRYAQERLVASIR